MFTRYFKDEQVLDPNFAITFGHCKLCDAPVHENVKGHMRMHKSQLRSWRTRKEREADKKRTSGLKNWQKERALEAEVTRGGDEDDDD